MSDLQFRFIDYRLCKLLFTVKDVKQARETIDINQSLSCKIKCDGTKAEVALDVLIDGEQSPFSIDVGFIGVFEFSQDLNTVETTAKEKILHVNCAAILFPFVRETIAEITRKAGLRPLLLSSFNFLNAYTENKIADGR